MNFLWIAHAAVLKKDPKGSYSDNSILLSSSLSTYPSPEGGGTRLAGIHLW
jgi:hypothetical protein